MLATTEAIVLHSRKYGDTSKIVTLYTKEFGRITVIAKGARRPKNKFGSSLEPLSYSSVTLYKSANKDLHLLSKSETIIPLRRVSESFEHLTTGLSIVEAISATQEIDEANEDLFSLLRDTLITLNLAAGNVFSVFVYFQMRLSAIMGFALDFGTCPETGEEVSLRDAAEFIFSLPHGAVFTPRLGSVRTGIRIGSGTLAALRSLSVSAIEDAEKFSFDDRQKEQLHNLFVQYFSYHLEKKFSYRSAGLRKISSM